LKKQPALLISLLFAGSIALAGIYRHDRKESEYVALGAQPQFACVGQLQHNGEKVASCVLISDKYVLTAAHIFVVASHLEKEIVVNPSLTVTSNEAYDKHFGTATDYSVVFNGMEYKCKTLAIYPRYLDTATRDGLDMAIMELETPVTGITPAVLSTSYNELHSDVTGVGWGVYGPADKPSEINRNELKKLGGENVVDSIGGYVLDGRPTAMYCDFDHPTDTTCNKMGSAIPRDLEYICGGGDSGGGLFVNTGTGWQLAGICHGSSINVTQFIHTRYYGQIMSWMRVSVFAGWIKQNAAL